MPRAGDDLQRTTNILRALSYAGNGSDSVGGDKPLLRCPKCDMFFIWRALNGRHQAKVMCARGE